MNGMERFAARRPIPFDVLATVSWMLVAGLGAIVASRLLHTSVTSVLTQSVGMLTATALLVVVMRAWGWLGAAGITRLGNWQLWLVTAGLLVYMIIAYRVAFFGAIAGDGSDVWRSEAGQVILRRQAVVGVAEEFLFRGFSSICLGRRPVARRAGAAGRQHLAGGADPRGRQCHPSTGSVKRKSV